MNEDEEKLLAEKILNDSIVLEEQTDKQGLDLESIIREFTDDRNVFRFSNTNPLWIFEDACIGAVSSSYEEATSEGRMPDRMDFCKWFRYWYHIDRSSIKAEQVERFKDMLAALINFEGDLEYRQAGIPEQDTKRGLLDRLRK